MLGLGWREKGLLVGLGSGESSQGRPRLTLLGPRLTPLVTRMWHLSSGHGLRRSDPPLRVVARSPQQQLCMMMMMMMKAARMMRLGHGLDSRQDWMCLWMCLNLRRRNQRRAEAQEG